MDNKIVIEFCPIKLTKPLPVSYKKGKIYQMPNQMYHVVWREAK